MIKSITFREALKVLGAKEIRMGRRDRELVAEVAGGGSIYRYSRRDYRDPPQLFVGGKTYTVYFHKEIYRNRIRFRTVHNGHETEDTRAEELLLRAGYALNGR